MVHASGTKGIVKCLRIADIAIAADIADSDSHCYIRKKIITKDIAHVATARTPNTANGG